MGTRRNIAIQEFEPLDIPPPVRQEALWKKVWKTSSLTEQDSRCVYCDTTLTVSAATADHVIPIKDGGRTTRSNIKAACKPCNFAKGHMPVDRFKKRIRVLSPGDPLELKLAHIRWRLSRGIEKAERRILAAVGMVA